MGGLGAIITTDGTGHSRRYQFLDYTWWANQYQEMSGTNTYADIQKRHD